MRYCETLTVPITLDRDAPSPLHDQIADQLAAAIRAGAMVPGTRMPSTRTLAMLLGVSRGVVSTGYDVLIARGFAEGRGGSGTYVISRRAPAEAGHRLRPKATAKATPVDFTPGRVDGEIFPLAAWRAAWRRASCQVPRVDALPALGLAELRAAIAEHLRRTRGLALTGHEVVVTGGAVPGLRLVLEALDTDPAAPVAVEAPAPRAWRTAVTGAGGTPVNLDVDTEGARVADAPPGCRTVVITTEGHLGWGRTLSARRRATAVSWAEATDGTVVEMACDTVFRPAANRLPRLIDRSGDQRSVLVGGFCETLTPALGLGYAVVPRPLAARIGTLVAERVAHPPYLTQLAMLDLLADGTIVRLMHRRGQVYKHKRAMVEQALAHLRPVITLDGLDAAGTAVLRLPAWLDSSDLGPELGLTAIGEHAVQLGYGHLPDDALRHGLRTLSAALMGRISAQRAVAA